MRADHAVRHNAAFGALVGLAVGDVMSQLAELPAPVCGGAFELPDWGDTAAGAFATAESFLNQELLDIDLNPTDAIAVAIALARADASPLLLGDPNTVQVCSIVAAAMDGALDLDAIHDGSGSQIANQIEMVASATNFVDAVSTSPRDSRPLAGALAGLRWGPAAVPAAWATLVAGPVRDRRYGLRQLRRLAERLHGQDAPVPPEPRRSLGPRQVAPRLWLSNMHAVPRFLADFPDGAVISLCPTTGAFDNHVVRREFAIHDAAGSKVNPLLSTTLDEVLATIAVFHSEGREVLVHCHHGASRTGLVLRAWLVQELGVCADEATTEAQVRWSKTSTWNNAFTKEIKRREDVD